MAQQTKNAFHVPELEDIGTMFDRSTLLVDADTEKAAFILVVPKTGTLGWIGFRTATVVQNETIRVSFRAVDAATGHPDGVVDQYRNIAIADADDDVWKETGLITTDGTDTGTKRAVTIGDILSVVFEHNPWNAGDVFRLASLYGPNGAVSHGPTYSDLYTGASWSKKSGGPNIALFYDDGSVAFILHVRAYSAASVAANYGSASTPDECGLKFKFPFPVTIYGAAAMQQSVGGDFDLVLYDSDGASVLAAAAFDKDLVQGNQAYESVRFATPVALLKDTYYYLSKKPGATTVNLRYTEVNSAGIWDQMPFGQEFHWCYRTDAGAWSVTLTRRPAISLIVSAFDDGIGGGGGGFPILGGSVVR